MEYPKHFISAGNNFCTFEKHVPAPLLRKSFIIPGKVRSANIFICGLGFYELYVNRQRLTKGALAPYISAPDDVIYYDRYDVSGFLQQGENAIGVILGNGMQNPLGGYVWEFDKARWRGAPKLALRLEVLLEDGSSFLLESDGGFQTSESPICFDDLRCGEHYDARKEQPGWNGPGFDDTQWKNAIDAPLPKGEPVLCGVEPIVVSGKIKPVSIIKQGEGYIYDFGVNTAGVCLLKVQGASGQEISLEHGEMLIEGKLSVKNIQFEPDGYVQRDIYICKGGQEEYTPRFTYHGFRYVFVTGIREEQATESLLTYLVMNSALDERGGFECSDHMANTLQILTRRSTLANFYYFPTDCPQREKNGWTCDAALSAEHTLLNLSPEKSYREWLRNIRKAQREDGALPGIVPTGGWGYQWGNGPAWDCALTWLPYFTYLYRGNIEILRENAPAIFRYLHYLSTRTDSNGLIAFGLGDWCPPGRVADQYKAPLEFTDSVISMDICKKAAFIFEVLGMELQRKFAFELYGRLRMAIREHLIDFGSMLAAGNCQTSQSMAIFFDVFESSEKAKAFEKLLGLIERKKCRMDTGILGSRVIFRVLSAFDRSNLAFKMITSPEFPSYGNWVARGATTLWEDFQPEGGAVNSLNHHFFGDISAWFIQCIAGIQLNPYGTNVNEVIIRPSFIGALKWAKAFHIAPAGKIAVEWTCNKDCIQLKLDLPEVMTGKIILQDSFTFDDGLAIKAVHSGLYDILRE